MRLASRTGCLLLLAPLGLPAPPRIVEAQQVPTVPQIGIANALGLTIPPAVLACADKIIR